MFGQLLPSPASSPEATPTQARHGRHLSVPCPPSPAPSDLSGHTSFDTPRRCSAPGGLWGGAGIPEVVIHPPEEEVFRMEDRQDHISHQDLLFPHSDAGKYPSARLCMVWLQHPLTPPSCSRGSDWLYWAAPSSAVALSKASPFITTQDQKL